MSPVALDNAWHGWQNNIDEDLNFFLKVKNKTVQNKFVLIL